MHPLSLTADKPMRIRFDAHGEIVKRGWDSPLHVQSYKNGNFSKFPFLLLKLSTLCRQLETADAYAPLSLHMSRSVSRVLSETTIYLGLPLPTGSSHLLRTAGPALTSSYHGVAPDRVYSVHVSPRDGWALTPPFHHHRAKKRGSLFLLHLSEGHPWRALPVILALWSPDFPHAQAFA